jgi:hypothetical protein
MRIWNETSTSNWRCLAITERSAKSGRLFVSDDSTCETEVLVKFCFLVGFLIYAPWNWLQRTYTHYLSKVAIRTTTTPAKIVILMEFHSFLLGHEGEKSPVVFRTNLGDYHLILPSVRCTTTETFPCMNLRSRASF